MPKCTRRTQGPAFKAKVASRGLAGKISLLTPVRKKRQRIATYVRHFNDERPHRALTI